MRRAAWSPKTMPALCAQARPPSSAAIHHTRQRYGTVLVGLDRDVSELDERVDARVTRMFEQGLVDEVRTLEARGLRDGRTASRALGYQQVLAAFDGECSIEEAAATTAQATRRFVRKQRSWFRRDQRVTWFDAAEPSLADDVLKLVTP